MGRKLLLIKEMTNDIKYFFNVIGKKINQTSVSDEDREIPTDNAGNSVNFFSGVIRLPSDWAFSVCIRDRWWILFIPVEKGVAYPESVPFYFVTFIFSIFNRRWMDGWTTCNLRPFNSISVIPGQGACDNERLCNGTLFTIEKISATRRA